MNPLEFLVYGVAWLIAIKFLLLFAFFLFSELFE